MKDDLRDELIGGSADALEVVIDSLTDVELLKDLPILGLAVRGVKVFGTVRDRIFAKKVQRFLLALSTFSEEERDAFHKQIDEKPEMREKLGEVLLLTLENMDNLDKAELLAVLFDAFSRRRIYFGQFQHLANAIDKANIANLYQLLRMPSKLYGSYHDNLIYLVGTGLVKFRPMNDPFGKSIIQEANGEAPIRLDPVLSDLGETLMDVFAWHRRWRAEQTD